MYTFLKTAYNRKYGDLHHIKIGDAWKWNFMSDYIRSITYKISLHANFSKKFSMLNYLKNLHMCSNYLGFNFYFDINCNKRQVPQFSSCVNSTKRMLVHAQVIRTSTPWVLNSKLGNQPILLYTNVGGLLNIFGY